VRPGNSGGPLLAPDGTVYGVVFAAATNEDDTGYVLTAEEIEANAAKGETATEPVSPQTCE
jgi:S1-C subfamily serine protease